MTRESITKTLHDVQVGDRIVRKGGVTFNRPFEVTEVVRIEGAVCVVKLEGGRFWPFQPSVVRAKATEIEVLAPETVVRPRPVTRFVAYDEFGNFDTYIGLAGR
jgi:hypothetical protein